MAAIGAALASMAGGTAAGAGTAGAIGAGTAAAGAGAGTAAALGTGTVLAPTAAAAAGTGATAAGLTGAGTVLAPSAAAGSGLLGAASAAEAAGLGAGMVGAGAGSGVTAPAIGTGLLETLSLPESLGLGSSGLGPSAPTSAVPAFSSAPPSLFPDLPAYGDVLTGTQNLMSQPGATIGEYIGDQFGNPTMGQNIGRTLDLMNQGRQQMEGMKQPQMPPGPAIGAPPGAFALPQSNFTTPGGGNRFQFDPNTGMLEYV